MLSHDGRTVSSVPSAARYQLQYIKTTVSRKHVSNKPRQLTFYQLLFQTFQIFKCYRAICIETKFWLGLH